MSVPTPATQRPKKKGFVFYGYFSVFLSLTILLGALIWLVYMYVPEYYLPLSFLMLVVGGVLAYVILTKGAKF